MEREFSGRVALVTGGSRGIGRATALRLAEDGADVAISYVTREAEARETVAEIEARGRRGFCLTCDVSQPEQVERLVRETEAALGPVDLLAHCGAISNLADHSELTFAQWKETIDVNLHGAFLVTFAVKDGMIARGYGRIVMVSSVAALVPRKMQIHYASAKAGVIAMIRCCAEAFAPHGVRMNGVAPGLIETEMMHVLSAETIAGVVKATPMGRVGEPQEIASVIRFLLSDESSFMTGQTLVPSGGRIMVP